MKVRIELGVAALAAFLLACEGGATAEVEVERTGREPAELSRIEMVAPPGEGAERYWPRWRGPTSQGLAVDSGYPDRWSDDENVIWKVPVPGRGNSSPIVWGDRIFLTTAYESGQRRSVLAFDRSSGERLWETFAPDARPERAHPKNGYASGTPATDGERIYAYLGNHGLLALDFDGEVAWHVDFGPMENVFHGSACSPLLYEDMVIVYQDHRSDFGSFIAAFDRETGEEVWWTDRDETLGWGSPVAIHAGDRDEVIVSSQHRVYAYDPATGDELWNCEGSMVEVTPTPVVGHGLLFASSGRSGPTLAIRPGGSGDVTNTHLVWRSNRGSPFIPSPIVYGDYLYMVNDMLGVVTVYEATTGEIAWRHRLSDEVQRESFSASPVAVDGKVFFTSDEGETFVIRAGPDFELLHVNRLADDVLASPALVDGRWYIRTHEHLMAIGYGD